MITPSLKPSVREIQHAPDNNTPPLQSFVRSSVEELAIASLPITIDIKPSFFRHQFLIIEAIGMGSCTHSHATSSSCVDKARRCKSLDTRNNIVDFWVRQTQHIWGYSPPVLCFGRNPHSGADMVSSLAITASGQGISEAEACWSL